MVLVIEDLEGASVERAGALVAREGYIRNGQQTLVLNQTPVSGPGVRPAS